MLEERLLIKNVQVLQLNSATKNLLFVVKDRTLKKDTVVTIGEPERMVLSGRYVNAVRLHTSCEQGLCGDGFYLLAEELGLEVAF